LITLALVVLAALPIPVAIRVFAGVFFLITLVSFLYPLYSYYMFSPKGENLQKKFYDLILDNLESHNPGKILDIGAGNGILAITAALRYQNAEVTGVDYWGKDWEYSKSVCERNARVARVAERIHFQKGDAARLNIPDATFDAVVSNLTFHEVKLVKRKSDLLREALRLLKPGGSFVFIDYFYDSRYYGESSEFKTLLRGLKLQKAELKPLHEVMAFPRLLRHPRALGKVGIVYGKK